jgi:hypothetical protein
MRELVRLIEAMPGHWLLRNNRSKTNPLPAGPLSEIAVPERKPIKALRSPRASAN